MTTVVNRQRKIRSRCTFARRLQRVEKDSEARDGRGTRYPRVGGEEEKGVAWSVCNLRLQSPEKKDLDTWIPG
jgi:hypothetical protein